MAIPQLTVGEHHYLIHLRLPVYQVFDNQIPVCRVSHFTFPFIESIDIGQDTCIGQIDNLPSIAKDTRHHLLATWLQQHSQQQTDVIVQYFTLCRNRTLHGTRYVTGYQHTGRFIKSGNIAGRHLHGTFQSRHQHRSIERRSLRQLTVSSQKAERQLPGVFNRLFGRQPLPYCQNMVCRNFRFQYIPQIAQQSHVS